MSVDLASIVRIGQLVLELVKIGASMPAELKALAERVEAGEEITDEELAQAKASVISAKTAWHSED